MLLFYVKDSLSYANQPDKDSEAGYRTLCQSPEKRVQNLFEKVHNKYIPVQ